MLCDALWSIRLRQGIYDHRENYSIITSFQLFAPYKISNVECLFVSCCDVVVFQNSREPTIVAKKSTKCKLGQRQGFSDTDIRYNSVTYDISPLSHVVRKLNTLYQCSGYPQTGASLITTDKPTPTTPSCTDDNK